MKILVIGSGAREHALTHSLAPNHQVWVGPGNPGTAQIATNVAVDEADPQAVAHIATQLGVDLVIIGPEAPLVAGVADAVRQQGIAVFGPDGAAAQLEGSKAFAKEIMAAADVPTGMAHVCDTLEEVENALDAFGAPHVVKEDGLAAGKGVVVTSDRQVALDHAQACLAKPGGRIVIEEFLDGPEVSLFCLTDGTTVVPLEPAQDFKRLLAGDDGPNTGGMGAYSPLTWAPENLVAEVVERVAIPTVNEMKRRGKTFVGLLYCGLALTSRGVRVIEFNARFGDPETQVVLARLKSDLGAALYAAATGDLEQHGPLRWHDNAAVTVVMASHGYPVENRTGDVISGLVGNDGEQLDTEEAYVLHAGSDVADDGSIITAGGRVLSVVGVGDDITSAREAAYSRISQVSFDGAQFRPDIAAGQS